VQLDSAEKSLANSDDDFVIRDKAYIASRRAELAEVLAATQRAKQQEAQAMLLVQAQREAQARVDRGELAQARQQLSTTEQQLSQANENLTTERQARDDAEKKAHEALDRLALANALSVKDEARGTVITVASGVLFASGKSDLLPGAQAKLAPIADALSHLPNHKIIIEGHTDSKGSDATNMQLSEKRAEAVKDFFASHGVDQGQMTATGLGESRPTADNATTEGRAMNRRVEIVLPMDKR
jgi:outer membrane protein OmpA-like peptidoglycan-associated protein